MMPSHYHVTQYAVELQRSALAKAEHERRLAQAAAAPVVGRDPSMPNVVRWLGLLPRLRLRRVPLAPWPEPRP